MAAGERKRKSTGTRPRLTPLENGTKCKNWCRQSCTFLISHVGLFALVVGYSIFGAFAFRALEASYEEETAGQVALLREKTVRRMWDITEHFNILLQANWTEKMTQEIRNFQNEVVAAVKEGYDGDLLAQAQQWSFSGAFLYSLTVITTIGYGNMAPKTFWGKLSTIFYAIFGIPLMFLYLTNIGNILARTFKYLYGRVCCQKCDQRSRHDQFNNFVVGEISTVSDFKGKGEVRKAQVRVPVTVCMLLVGGYICAGGCLFSVWEGWDYLDGSYFCFVTLSTIGFGDLVPGDSVVSDEGSQEKLVICSLYILGGMCLIAMCFNLVQEEVVMKLRNVGRKIGILPNEVED